MIQNKKKKRKTGILIFNCESCDYIGKDERDLRCHVRSCNNKPLSKVLVCNVCSHSFPSLGGLKTHQRSCLKAPPQALLEHKSEPSCEGQVNNHSARVVGFRIHKRSPPTSISPSLTNFSPTSSPSTESSSSTSSSSTPSSPPINYERSPKIQFPSAKQKTSWTKLNKILEESFISELPAV